MWPRMMINLIYVNKSEISYAVLNIMKKLIVGFVHEIIFKISITFFIVLPVIIVETWQVIIRR